jgi:hypothetical protein
MVIVYFETKIYSEVIAKFANEDIYMLCYEALKKQAENMGGILTESIVESEL